MYSGVFTIARIAVIATISEWWFPYDRNLMIAEIELKSISATVVTTIATIAEKWFPYDRNDGWTFLSAIAAIVTIEAIIWIEAIIVDH